MMLRNKESIDNSTQQRDENEALPASKVALRKKAILSGASALLVIILILGAVLAWYTRLTNVTGMTFDAATFDVTASYLSESKILNPFNYSEVENGLSAPGVQGYVPIAITTTTDGEVEIQYRLNIDTGAMASEFQERIRFYYYTKDEDGTYVEHDLGFGEDDIMGTLSLEADQDSDGNRTVIEHVYWEWIYEGDISTVLISPDDEYDSDDTEIDYTEYNSLGEMTNEQIYTAIYNWRNSSNSDVDDYYDELNAESMIDVTITTNSNVLKKLFNGTAVTVSASATTGYGETIYAAVSSTDENYENKIGANIRDYIENYILYEWDYTDTQVAIGTWDETMTSANGNVFTAEYEVDTDGEDTDEIAYYAYQMAMQVSIEVTAVQAEPLDEGEESSYPDGGGTVKLETTSATSE